MIVLYVIIAILAIMGILFLVFVGTDVFFLIEKKLSRRKIRSYSDFSEWKNKVTECAKRWSVKMPVVRLTDNDRLIVLDMLKKQYKHSSLQGWQYAQLADGLCAVGESGVRDFLRENGVKEIDEGFVIYHEWNNGILSDPDAEKLMNEYLSVVEKRTRENGLIEYRKGYWDICLADTLAFVCPVLVKYGEYKNDKTLVKKAMDQIKSYCRCGCVEEFGLYAHGYDSVKGVPCESVGWGRGTGWFLLGLLYCHESISDGEDKEFLRVEIEKALKNVSKYQRADGGWSTGMVSNTNYDGSATAIIAYFILKASELCNKTEEYKNAVESAVKKLMSCTSDDGAVEHCEGDCHGIGRYSKLYGKSPFAQGMTLKLISEYEKSGE